MTNEIKEIREYISCPQFGDDHYGKWGALRLDQREKIKHLLDYITNLQEENKRYKKIFEGKERFSKIMPDDMEFIILSKADYDRQQEDIELTAIDLQQRIDQAVEYIKWNLDKNEELIEYFNYDANFNELLNILRGDE